MPSRHHAHIAHLMHNEGVGVGGKHGEGLDNSQTTFKKCSNKTMLWMQKVQVSHKLSHLESGVVQHGGRECVIAHVLRPVTRVDDVVVHNAKEPDGLGGGITLGAGGEGKRFQRGHAHTGAAAGGRCAAASTALLHPFTRVGMHFDAQEPMTTAGEAMCIAIFKEGVEWSGEEGTCTGRQGAGALARGWPSCSPMHA